MFSHSDESDMPANFSKPLSGKRLRSNEMLPERDMSEWLMSTVAAAQLPAQPVEESPSNDPLPEKDVSTVAPKPAQPPVEIQRKPKRSLKDAEETDALPPKRARLVGGAPRRRRRVVEEDSDEEDTSTGQAVMETYKSPEKSSESSSMPLEADEPVAEEDTATREPIIEETQETTEKNTDNSDEPTSSSCKTGEAVTEEAKDSAGSQSEENTKDSSGCTSSPRKADEAAADDIVATTGQETEESIEKNSSGLTSGPRKSVEATAEAAIATTESSEPTSNSPKSENATHEEDKSNEKSAEDSSSSEPTSSSYKASDTPDSQIEVTPPTSMPEVSEKAAESSQKGASTGASKQSTRTTERVVRDINGLVRVNNQCFSNSVIQMVDAALEGHNVDAVLGPVKSTKPFTDPHLTPDDVFVAAKPRKTRKSKATDDGKKPISKLDRIKRGIHSVIDESRKKKNWRALSPKRHLRSLVHKLRSNRGDGSSRWLNGYVFQHVLAHGDENAPRSHLDGLEQQDCYEYYQALIEGVDSSVPDETSDSSSTHSSASLRSLFEVSEEETTVCMSCGHKGETKAASSTAVSVIVPSKTRGGSNLTDLLKETTASDFDLLCPKCGQKQERETKITGTSDNLVVHLNRIGEDLFSKTMDAVHLPMQPIDFAGSKFVLNAVVRHEGPDALADHYTILRRRSPDWVTREKALWWRFDDDEVKPMEAKDVKDGFDRAQSVMLLFKAL